jgi:RNA polymerase sigma-70 factor, ECF subfamily
MPSATSERLNLARLSTPGVSSVVLGMGGTRVRDEELARALYAEHAGALLAFVQRLLGGDRPAAEDIVQETLLRAWRNADRLPPNAIRPWLFTTARHLVIDAYRARRARPVETSGDQLDSIVAADDIDSALNSVLVADALGALSPAHQAVLIDCYYRGRTTREVAQERGLPAGTVRSRLHYALRALGLALQERGVAQP